MTHFTFKKLFISKFLDFGQCRGSGSEQHPRHCPLCILLFGDASDFGIGPECVRRFHSCNISLQGNKDFCYNNSSKKHVTLQIPQCLRLNNSCIFCNEIRMDYHFIKRESLVSPCGHVIFPFH